MLISTVLIISVLLIIVNHNIIMIAFGNKIKELRKIKGLTQKQLAKELNMSLSSIAMYEINKAQPSPDVLLLMSKFFDVSMDELFGIEK